MKLNRSWVLNSDRSYVHMVVGKVQSGKTGEIIRLCEYLLSKNIKPVVIVRNRKCDVEQFVGRFPGEGLRGRVQTMYDMLDSKGRFIGSLNNKVPLVVMGNKSQLLKAHELLMSTRVEYTVIKDEGDMHYQSKSRDEKPTECKLNLLEKDSNNVYSFTATVASLVRNQPESGSYKIYDMSLSTNYYGVDHFKHVPIRSRVTYDFDSHSLMDKDDIDKVYNEGLKSPKAWGIHNTSRLRFVQYAISDYIQENFPQYVVMTYNGTGTLVHVPQDTADARHKTITFEGGVPISRVLTLFKNYKYLTVITGDLANRGISFVSDDYSVHCDFQYYRCLNGHPHGEQLLQACRLSGVYRDTSTPTLKFYCEPETWELIQKHYDYSNQNENSYEIYKELEKSETVCRPKLN